MSVEAVIMGWRENIPSSIVFVDVETTGLTEDDRVVSLGAVWLSTASVSAMPLPVSFVHLIFNPEKKCHPAAARVHGYSDWLLCHQEGFSAHSAFLRQYLNCAELIVAHNAEFDLSFINRELRRAGQGELDRPVYCTMEGSRARNLPSAALGRVCEQIGIARSGQDHGALEDSWLAMMVYLWLHGCPFTRPFSDAGSLVEPFNFRKVSAEPINTRPASNTGLSAAGTSPEAARISALVESIKQAKREGRLADAEIELLRELDRQEIEAHRIGWGVAPWYYEQLAVIYSKQGRHAEEIKVLQRYQQQPKAPGAMPSQLKERLEKAMARYGTGTPTRNDSK
jgi:DNA polymerase III subunit epsilon